MTKKITVRFYTDSGLYKGWKYLTRTSYHNDISSWISSGNVIMINKDRIDWNNRSILYLTQQYLKAIKGEVLWQIQ